MTMLYSLLHFLVDGICAWGMLGRFRGFDAILLYNFCAFVLQLPLGAVLDRFGGRRTPMVFAAAGCGLTLLGACTSPLLLGLGNALFHVGGGVDVIRDGGKCEKLGIFVAPGAMGLFLGGLLAGRSLPLLPVLILMAALLRGRGTTVFVENIFENRYRHVDELRRMGADISVADRVAVVSGVERLHGARVRCTDLRGGAALMVAALTAEGESVISDIHHIHRGYEDPVRDLGALGAEIRMAEKQGPEDRQ